MAIQEGIFPASMSVLNSNLTLNSQQTLEHAEKLIFLGINDDQNKNFN